MRKVLVNQYSTVRSVIFPFFSISIFFFLYSFSYIDSYMLHFFIEFLVWLFKYSTNDLFSLSYDFTELDAHEFMDVLVGEQSTILLSKSESDEGSPSTSGSGAIVSDEARIQSLILDSSGRLPLVNEVTRNEILITITQNKGDLPSISVELDEDVNNDTLSITSDKNEDSPLTPVEPKGITGFGDLSGYLKQADKVIEARGPVVIVNKYLGPYNRDDSILMLISSDEFREYKAELIKNDISKTQTGDEEFLGDYVFENLDKILDKYALEYYLGYVETKYPEWYTDRRTEHISEALPREKPILYEPATHRNEEVKENPYADNLKVVEPDFHPGRIDHTYFEHTKNRIIAKLPEAANQFDFDFRQHNLNNHENSVAALFSVGRFSVDCASNDFANTTIDNIRRVPREFHDFVARTKFTSISSIFENKDNGVQAAKDYFSMLIKSQDYLFDNPIKAKEFSDRYFNYQIYCSYNLAEMPSFFRLESSYNLLNGRWNANTPSGPLFTTSTRAAFIETRNRIYRSLPFSVRVGLIPSSLGNSPAEECMKALHQDLIMAYYNNPSQEKTRQYRTLLAWYRLIANGDMKFVSEMAMKASNFYEYSKDDLTNLGISIHDWTRIRSYFTQAMEAKKTLCTDVVYRYRLFCCFLSNLDKVAAHDQSLSEKYGLNNPWVIKCKDLNESGKKSDSIPNPLHEYSELHQNIREGVEDISDLHLSNTYRDNINLYDNRCKTVKRMSLFATLSGVNFYSVDIFSALKSADAQRTTQALINKAYEMYPSWKKFSAQDLKDIEYYSSVLQAVSKIDPYTVYLSDKDLNGIYSIVKDTESIHFKDFTIMDKKSLEELYKLMGNVVYCTEVDLLSEEEHAALRSVNIILNFTKKISLLPSSYQSTKL